MSSFTFKQNIDRKKMAFAQQSTVILEFNDFYEIHNFTFIALLLHDHIEFT